MRRIRENAISGMITDIGQTQTSLQFNEWFGKEGLDFNLYNPLDDDMKTISLTRDEIHCLVVAAIAANYVDLPSAEKEAKELVDESKKLTEDEEQKRMLAAQPNPITGFGDLNLLASL